MALFPLFQPATLLIFFLLLISNGLAEKTCEAEDGVCRQSDQRTCDLPEGLCAPGGGTFRGGGSAQAYKPNAPIKSDICNADSYNTTRYKVAGWPFTRSWQKSSPRLSIHVSILSCSRGSSTIEDSASSTCCCRPIDEEKGGSDDVVVEVWQTRPDGSFSSLRTGNGFEDGDCRAVGRIGASSFTTFTTVAPGSTGCLGGLGPFKVEFWPYGSPYIHFLVTAPGHTPTLVDVPIMFNKNNYEQKSFFGPDWRGPAWVKEKTSSYSLYEITSWKGETAKREIEINLDLYLTAKEERETSRDEQTKPTFCSSILYGLPSSFFLEPISVCAPSLLDFFPL